MENYSSLSLKELQNLITMIGGDAVVRDILNGIKKLTVSDVPQQLSPLLPKKTEIVFPNMTLIQQGHWGSRPTGLCKGSEFIINLSPLEWGVMCVLAQATEPISKQVLADRLGTSYSSAYGAFRDIKRKAYDKDTGWITNLIIDNNNMLSLNHDQPFERHPPRSHSRA